MKINMLHAEGGVSHFSEFCFDKYSHERGI